MIDLKQLKTLEQAATLAPWSVDEPFDPCDVSIWGPPPEDKFVANMGPAFRPVELVINADEADARLLVALRNAAPDLLALLEEARETMTKQLNSHAGLTSGQRMVYGACQCEACKQARVFLSHFAPADGGRA